MTIRSLYAQFWRSAKMYRASKGASFSPSDDALAEVLSGGRSSSGVFVSATTAQTISAFWNGIDQISNAVAMLPLITYKRLAVEGMPQRSSKIRDPNFRLSETLGLIPNQWQTSFQWRKLLQSHALLRGNGYAYRNIKSNGKEDLIPLNPDRVTPFLITIKKEVRSESGTRTFDLPVEKAYRYQPENGGSEVVFLNSEILHIMGLSNNGFVGIDPITAARRSYGISIGAEEYGARFYSNNATPEFVLTYPGPLGDDEYKNLRKSWMARHSGTQNAHVPAILEQGLDVKTLGISPENSQFLQTRKFQIAEVARWLNIQPHKIKDLERATNNNIEQQSLEYLTDTIAPWLKNWEQSIAVTLYSENERRTHFSEFLTNALMRGDTAARSQFYKDGRLNGWFSINDIRDLENMTPIGEAGEVYMVAANTKNAKELLTVEGDDE